MPNDWRSTPALINKNKEIVQEPYYGDRDMYEEMYIHIKNLIWNYTREIYNGSNSSGETID